MKAKDVQPGDAFISDISGIKLIRLDPSFALPSPTDIAKARLCSVSNQYVLGVSAALQLLAIHPEASVTPLAESPIDVAATIEKAGMPQDVRAWKCPGCQKVKYISYDRLAIDGFPFCDACSFELEVEQQMEMQPRVEAATRNHNRGGIPPTVVRRIRCAAR